MAKKQYTYKCGKENEATEIVKWLRRNLGTRGEGWDYIYSFSNNIVIIHIWDEKLQFMYEMWKT